MLEGGAQPRDLTECSAWRETTDLCILEALNMYGSYLIGQTNGFSDSLNLPAVLAAFTIEQVPSAERPEMTRQLIQIHARAMKIHQMKAKKANG